MNDRSPSTPPPVASPTSEKQEGFEGVARAIAIFLGMVGPHYGSKMYRHLKNLGEPFPTWLYDIIPDKDHTPPMACFAEVIAQLWNERIDKPPVASSAEELERKLYDLMRGREYHSKEALDLIQSFLVQHQFVASPAFEAMREALQALLANRGAASLVRNPLGIKIRKQANEALVLAEAELQGAK